MLPHLTLNGSVSLTSSPVIDLAATTGRADLFVGGQASFSSSQNDITAWTLGAGAHPLLSPAHVCQPYLSRPMPAMHAWRTWDAALGPSGPQRCHTGLAACSLG